MTIRKLVLVIGLPATGKTTFAQSLSAKTGFIHLNSDKVRHELNKTGMYDQETKAAIYAEVLGRAKQFLDEWQSVIIDATFHKQERRIPFEKLEKKYGIPVHWIEIRASEPAISERMKKKRKYSEADFKVYLQIKAAFEPLNVQHLVLRSDKLNIEEMVNGALVFINWKQKIMRYD